MILFLVCRHPVDDVGGAAVHHATVGRLDEAVLVHVGKERQRADKTDVGAFGRLDGAHACIVGVVDVAHCGRHVGAAAGARLMARQTTRSQGRETTLVSEARKGVGLIHELRQLRRAKELFDSCHNGANVDERLRRDVIGILGCHALAHHALHTAHTDAELVLQQLAHGTHATIAKVVDVVHFLGGIAVTQSQQVTKGSHDILWGEHVDAFSHVKIELLVDLVAAYASQVVALRIEVQAVQKRTGSIHCGRLAGALTLVELDERLFTGLGSIRGQGVSQHVRLAQKLGDLLVGLSEAQGAKHQGGALTTLAVDGDDELALLVNLKLEPSATCRNELHLVDVDIVVELFREVDTGGTHELGYHHALSAIDDEGAAVCHKREVAHEHQLLLDLTGLLVGEANLHQKRGLVGEVFGAALGQSMGRIAKLVGAKGNLHSASVVFDRRALCEGIREPLPHETLERFLLDGDEVGQLHRRANLAEAHAARSVCGGDGRVCGTHQAFPPLKRHIAAIVAN